DDMRGGERRRDQNGGDELQHAAALSNRRASCPTSNPRQLRCSPVRVSSETRTTVRDPARPRTQIAPLLDRRAAAPHVIAASRTANAAAVDRDRRNRATESG